MKGSCTYTVSMLFLDTVGFQWHTTRISTLQVGGGRPENVCWLVEALPWVRRGCFNFTKFQNHRSKLIKHVYLSYTSGNSNNGKWKNIVCYWMTSTWSVSSIVIEVRKMLPTCTVTLTQRFSPPSFSQAIPTFAAEVRPGWKPQGKHQRAIFQQRHVGSFLSIF